MSTPPRVRLDIALEARGLAQSRARARDAVLRGTVRVNGVPAGKPGMLVGEDDRIEVDDPAQHYVSRAALKLIAGLESGSVQLEDASGRGFFELLLQNTREGFFADPLYGGNRDMVGWKMIGFPGARYDYRDWVEHHNEKYPRPPVAITGRPDWTPRQG